MSTKTTCAVIASSTPLGQEMMNRCRETGASVIGIAENNGVDFGNVDAVRDALLEVRPNIVFNAIAASASRTEGSADTVAGTIATLTSNISSASESVNAFMVHFSFSHVFKPNRQHAYDVDDTRNGTSPIARELIDAERAAQKNERSAIVRTGHCLSLDICDIVEHLRFGRRVTVPVSHSVQPACCHNTAAIAMRVGMCQRSCIVHVANSGDCGWYQFISAIRDDLDCECDVVPSFVGDELAENAFPDHPVLNLRSMVEFGGHSAHWRDAVRRCLHVMYAENINGTRVTSVA